MFNLLHVTSGDKVDFWLLTDSPFDKSRFSRRTVDTIDGVALQVSTPEDTVLAKLVWDKKSGGSEKQRYDAQQVFEVQRPTLDWTDLELWAQRLGVADRLSELKTRLPDE
jgi:hypothetical protein